MTEAIFTYLNHRIEINLPDPSDDNTIHFTIYRVEGTYDESLYNSYICQRQFSGVADDPNQWVIEAINHAIRQLSFDGIEYHTQPQEPMVDDSAAGVGELLQQ